MTPRTERVRQWARNLKTEVSALALAMRDPRVAWPVKLLAGLVVAYALSPVDLIPDFIPVLGYLDDLLLVPLGILLVRKLLPPEVLADCREQARTASPTRRRSWVAAGVIILVWLVGAAVLGRWIWRRATGAP